MAIAFLLLNSELGAEREILTELKGIREVRETHMVYGVYDIIAKVETDSIAHLNGVIAKKIRKLNRVRSTLTMIVIE